MTFDITPRQEPIAPIDTTQPSATDKMPRPATPDIRVVFMGTPEFSKDILEGLLDCDYHIVACYTRPDKPVGRKQELMLSPVKRISIERNIPVEQPIRFDAAAIDQLRSYHPDLVVVAAYGRLLPEHALSVPKFGCLNVHTSLLPRWRGASPVQNALLAGDTGTGVTIIRMDVGMDTGPILAQEAFHIRDNDTRDSLLSRMTEDGIRLLADSIPRWVEHRITPREQDGSQATLCQLIEREDGHIFWSESAESVLNRYRALHPWPGIFTFWNRTEGLLRLKLVRISIQKSDPSASHSFGEVFQSGEKIAVQTGVGLVFIEEVQPEGKNAMPIRDFLNGRPDFIGAILT